MPTEEKSRPPRDEQPPAALRPRSLSPRAAGRSAPHPRGLTGTGTPTQGHGAALAGRSTAGDAAEAAATSCRLPQIESADPGPGRRPSCSGPVLSPGWSDSGFPSQSSRLPRVTKFVPGAWWRISPSSGTRLLSVLLGLFRGEYLFCSNPHPLSLTPSHRMF